MERLGWSLALPTRRPAGMIGVPALGIFRLRTRVDAVRRREWLWALIIFLGWASRRFSIISRSPIQGRLRAGAWYGLRWR
jgi:hypothetical protein